MPQPGSGRFEARSRDAGQPGSGRDAGRRPVGRGTNPGHWSMRMGTGDPRRRFLGRQMGLHGAGFHDEGPPAHCFVQSSAAGVGEPSGWGPDKSPSPARTTPEASIFQEFSNPPENPAARADTVALRRGDPGTPIPPSTFSGHTLARNGSTQDPDRDPPGWAQTPPDQTAAATEDGWAADPSACARMSSTSFSTVSPCLCRR